MKLQHVIRKLTRFASRSVEDSASVVGALASPTRTLDGTLRPLFERWYPGLANDNRKIAAQAAAA